MPIPFRIFMVASAIIITHLMFRNLPEKPRCPWTINGMIIQMLLDFRKVVEVEFLVFAFISPEAILFLIVIINRLIRRDQQ